MTGLDAFPSLPHVAGRVTLRRLTESDRPAFQAYRGDPEVGRFQGWRPLSDEDATAFLLAMSAAPLFRPGHWCQLGVSETARPELIGDLGLHLAEDGRWVELGFTLQRSSQGRGLATAAVQAAIDLVFTHTEAGLVRCVTDARNEPCVRLLERIGMKRADTTAAIFRGAPCEEHHYVLNRNDEARRRGLSSG
ncbi:MAG TPA: GNAT family N-acetyltransferase [Opitutaceae bacterium]